MTARGASILEKPVFFIGMPRSGSTIVFETFSVHEALGWLSNYSKRAPNWPVLNTVVRLVDNRWWCIRGAKVQGQEVRLLNWILPRPQEAYPFWEEHVGHRFLSNFMRGEVVRVNERQKLRRVIERTLRFQGKRRFVAKVTGPPRIAYLQSIFPDAQFIHVIRDGRAVVQSLLKVGFWKEKGGLERPFWEGGLDEEELALWNESSRSPAVLAALQWRKVINSAREESAKLSKESYLEIKYEDFVGSPHSLLRRAMSFCGLSDSQRVHRYVDTWSGGGS